MDVKGRIDVSQAAAFEQALRNVIEDTDRAVIMDLRELTYIGRSGLHVVLMVAKSLDARGAGLALYGPSEEIREMFRIIGFDKIMPVHDTSVDARAALGV